MNSRGWAIIRERMEAEILQAALMLGDRRKMDADEVSFQRGAIWAGRQLLEVPAKLKAMIQSAQPFEPPPLDPLGKDDKVVAPPLPTSDETPRQGRAGEP